MPHRFFAADGGHGESIVITHGTNAGHVTFTAGGSYLHIHVEGEAQGESLVRCVREALDAGLIDKNTRSLIDLTLFTGSVDWKALNAIRVMVPWGEGRETRVAYLVRNSRFATIVKVVEILFGGMRHRVFSSRETALAWLVPEDAIAVEAQGSPVAIYPPHEGVETDMALVQNPICDFGWKAKEFSLKGTDGKTYSFGDVRGKNGTLVVFICNHCPYVRAIIDRLVGEVRPLRELGIGVVAVMPNDTNISPGDSFEAMKAFAKEHDFTFPYVMDETQDVARAYGAVCTPDFFGFNAKDELQYRGRLDESKTALVEGARRDLYEAMKLIAETGQGPKDQIPSMGCSIKWRA